MLILLADIKVYRDLEKISLWAWQWKMEFNADKTEEVIFSCKRNKPIHPGLKLGEEVIVSKLEHKHLGVILDSKLNFKSHIREAILKARTLGTRSLVPRVESTQRNWFVKIPFKICIKRGLDQTYKLFVRPHLDCGDIIYHKYDPDMQLNSTQQLEQTQYKAALAVTGA